GRRGPSGEAAEALVRAQPPPPEPLCGEGVADRRAGGRPGTRRNHAPPDRRRLPGLGRGTQEDRGRGREGDIPPRTRDPESQGVRRPDHGVSMAIVDATGHVVGRLASVLAKRLLNGEEIVVVNAEKAIVTGRKKVVFEEYRARHQRGSTASRMRGF